MSRSERTKGLRVEREIVELHQALGVDAERVPLSGASHYRGGGHDVDVHAFGPHAAALVGEVKARKSGEGFALLERWLGDFDLLFLRRDRQKPLVVMPWETYERFLQWSTFQSGSPSTPPSSKSGPAEKISAKPATNGSQAEKTKQSGNAKWPGLALDGVPVFFDEEGKP